MIKSVVKILEEADKEQYHFRPAEIYNETWLLRIILDWFAARNDVSHPWAFLPNSNWISEAILPSAFLRFSLPFGQPAPQVVGSPRDRYKIVLPSSTCFQ